MNINDLMTNVRLRLSDPRNGKPNDFQVLNAVCTQLRIVKSFERNTGNPWSLDDAVVDVIPGGSAYQINVANFGTPLAVISWAPDLPTWVPRLIDFFQPQNMVFDWGLPNNMAAYWYWPNDGSNCTAMRCAIYWHNGSAFIEFLPVPQLAASYKIRFLETGDGVNSAALTATLVSNTDADVVEVRAALSLLASTEWNSPDTKDGRSYNAERRKDLSDTLQGEEKELRRQFEASKLTTTGPRMTNRFNPAWWSG